MFLVQADIGLYYLHYIILYVVRSILSNPETHYKLNNENYSQNNKRITLMCMHISKTSFVCSSLIMVHKTNELTFHTLKRSNLQFSKLRQIFPFEGIVYDGFYRII